MQKGFAPILVLVGILVIIGIAGGAYLFGKSQVAKSQLPNSVVTSQTPQPTTVPQPSSAPEKTANWKTYTNKRFGYSLKYPQDWSIEENVDRVVWKSVDYKASDTGNIVSGQEINIFVNENSTKKSIKNWWGSANTDYVVSNITAFKIDDHEAIKYNLSAPGGGVYGALIDGLDKVYAIEAFSVQDKIQDTIEIFNQILSTFKFIN